MNIVNKIVVQCFRKQWIFCRKLYAVPAHVRNFQSVGRWLEAFYGHVKNTDAVGVALFRVGTKQLLADTDSQKGLRQVADHFVEAVMSQMGHCRRGFAHAGKYHFVRFADFFRVVGYFSSDSDTP